MKFFKVAFLLVFILFFTLSCNLTRIASSEEPVLQNESNQQPSGVEDLLPQLTQSEPVSQPVGLRKGLSTLDSYRLTIEVETIGPSEMEISRIKYQQENAKAQDASFITIENYEQTLDDPEPINSQTYQYRIAGESCSGSDEDGYTYSIMQPDKKELQDIMMDIFDVNLLIENPQFVGEENLNGIQVNHFVFQLNGLGVTSGVEVVQNQGEYWLAVDGNYIVRYSLLVETKPNPEEINHLKVFVNLEEINQPKTLTMPSGCEEAKNNPE